MSWPKIRRHGNLMDWEPRNFGIGKVLPCDTARISSFFGISAGEWWGSLQLPSPHDKPALPQLRLLHQASCPKPQVTRRDTKDFYTMDATKIRQDMFPATTREASGLVNGIATEVTSTNFTDKILVTISQEGRLSQWV